MRAPSFRCTEEDGQLVLHYYSDRPGLEHIVIGIVKEVAKQLHDTEVEVTILQNKTEGSDHVKFLISEKFIGAGRQTRPELAEMRQSLSLGKNISCTNILLKINCVF